MNNINPDVWGRPGWIFLECVALGYPNNPTNEQIKQYRNFLSNISVILPCEKCRFNYEKHLMESQLTDDVLANNETLLAWIIEMRNKVNILNNKPLINRDYVMQELNGPKTYHKLMFLIILLLILIIIYLVIKQKTL